MQPVATRPLTPHLDNHVPTHPPQETSSCGCCNREVSSVLAIFQCRTCNESICGERRCLGLCRCDRNAMGFIVQMWFRWSENARRLIHGEAL